MDEPTICFNAKSDEEIFLLQVNIVLSGSPQTVLEESLSEGSDLACDERNVKEGKRERSSTTTTPLLSKFKTKMKRQSASLSSSIISSELSGERSFVCALKNTLEDSVAFSVLVDIAAEAAEDDECEFSSSFYKLCSKCELTETALIGFFFFLFLIFFSYFFELDFFLF